MRVEAKYNKPWVHILFWEKDGRKEHKGINFVLDETEFRALQEHLRAVDILPEKKPKEKR